jgi:hypothetical protein
MTVPAVIGTDREREAGVVGLLVCTATEPHDLQRDHLGRFHADGTGAAVAERQGGPSPPDPFARYLAR